MGCVTVGGTVSGPSNQGQGPLRVPLNCPNHGVQEWQGDVYCSSCNAFYQCEIEIETARTERHGAKKYTYPDAPEKGMCTCGKRLFGGTDFTARPMCHECCIAVLRRKAELEGKLFWTKNPHAGSEDEDFVDPKGDGSYELYVFELKVKNKDHPNDPDSEWQWEMVFPSGHCSGRELSREKARAMAEKFYRAADAEK